MEKEITADDFLKGLNDHSVIFELSIEPEYSERQLILFAEMYHKKAQEQTPDVMEEVRKEAYDEAQGQDWNDLGSKKLWIEAFIQGAQFYKELIEKKKH